MISQECPLAENDSFIPTLNRQGAVWLFIDEITLAYLDFIAQIKGTVLEVAAGYGHIIIKALEAGADRAFANEIDARQAGHYKTPDAGEIRKQISLTLGTIPRVA